MAAKMRPPHEVKIVNNIPRLVKENFTIEFRCRDHAPVIFQEGAAFDVGGDEMAEIPEWVWEQYGKLSDDAKAKLKMTPPVAAKAAK